METTDLNNQLNLKQTELNFTSNPEKRKNLQNDIAIIRHKLEIARIKHLIKTLQQS
jgi:hypothetical protein